MQSNSFRFTNVDGGSVLVREWLADTVMRAAIVIAHGAAEHSARYERFAMRLTAEGFAVYAPDHRGHGQTAESLEQAGNAGPDGFNGIVRDLRQLVDLVTQRHGVQPFLFGHSMGAALTQRFMQLHGHLLRGVLLSGAPGVRPNLEQAAAYTAQLAQGDKADHTSELFKQSFASFNEGLDRASTGYEWLSRDPDEVKKYVDDPWCGFPFTNRLVAEMSQSALDAAQPDNIARIPKSLPILLFAGTHDRVGGNGRFVREQAERYRAAGIVDVQLTLYPEGRHEMLNDVNREQVHADVLAWLRQRI